MKLPLPLALLLCLLAAACTTPPKTDWDARVGSYTFDAAVLELGPPEKSAPLTDGTRVADWLLARGRSNPNYHSFPDGRVIRTEGVRDQDQLLRLTFKPDGQLQRWQRVWR
ncbi:MAG: hypothetical protein RL514_4820 [Verrucomicrobiota bacterium]|jgi:hypothetical protein